jgi:Ca-activated chloride channel homolog
MRPSATTKPRRAAVRSAVLAVVASFVAVLVVAQTSGEQTSGEQTSGERTSSERSATPSAAGAGPSQAREARDSRAGAKNPYSAYEAGDYDRALEGFVERRVARPEDPQLQLNVGSAYYQLGDYQAAEQEYKGATEAKRVPMRAEALYNLGNSAYRQGRLEEAVGLYQDALALDSEDEDAKYNLEFVQREIERRRQQAQEREQQPQQQDPQQQQQQQQDQQQSDGEQEREEQGESEGEEDGEREDGSSPGEDDPDQREAPPEGSGGPQEQERGEGEPRESPSAQESAELAMTPEEAARYLQGLDEKRPADPKRARAARRAPGGKPW